MASRDVVNIEPLDVANYGPWRFRVEMALKDKGLWGVVSTGEGDGDKKDKALAIITATVKDHHLPILMACDGDPKEAWYKLAAAYQPKSASRQAQLRLEMSTFKKEPSEPIAKYVARALALWAEMRTSGVPVLQAEVTNAVLEGLPGEYEHLAQCLRTMNRDGNLDLGVVQSELQAAELRIRRRETEESALAARFRAMAPAKPRCSHCGKPGHSADRCWKLHPELLPARFQQQPAAGEPQRAMSARALAAVAPSGGSWAVDSGCTQHMTGNADIFTKMEPLAYEVRVSFGNGSTAPAQGIGTVAMQVPGGPVVLLTEVLYVPGLALNLFSVKQALNRGAVIEFRDATCTVCLEGELLLKCTACSPGNLFEFCPQYLASANVAGVLETAELWHRRFGHLGYGNLERLVRENLVDGIGVPANAFKTAGAEVCEPCELSKQHRHPFPASETKTARPVELVHMDVCGPMATTSLGGSKYLATFLDDWTGLCVVKPVALKSEVPAAVQDVLNLLENLSGHKLRAVRTDRGGEYLNRELDRYFAAKGVLHQTTAPYTPEQNGKAERLNRTLMERVRAMLADSGLDQSLWSEAAQTATYIRNRSPTATGAKTPFELFFGTRPDVRGMRAFGCTAYVHIPKGQRTKLDPVSLKGVFVGYEAGSKAYRVLLPDRNRVVVSRDVTFNEAPSKPAESEAVPEPAELRGVLVDVGGGDGAERAPAGGDGEPVEPNDDAEEFVDARDNAEVDEAPAEEVEPAPNAPPAPPAQPGTFAGGRFPARQRQPPRPYWQAHAAEVELMTAPNTVEEALARPDAAEWVAAMNEEVEALLSKETYTLVELPRGKKALGVKFVFTIKRDANGNVERYKARLVVKGFLQREGVDFNEVFAPVSKHSTLRALLALVAAEDLELHQLDIKTAFLNGDLEEEVYVEQPPGFKQGGPGVVCHLKKALYGLRQAPRAWHLTLKAELAKLGFIPSEADPALFTSKRDGGRLYLLVYVDDILVAGARLDDVTGVKTEICATFEARDMGEARFFLGLEISRDRGARLLKLSQRRATADLVSKFGLEECKTRGTPLATSTRLTKTEGDPLDTSVYPYCELVGGLLYLSVCTRPDIAQAVGALARYMSHPMDAHWRGAKSVLRYLAGSLDVGLTFADDGNHLRGFCDADYAGDQDTRRSTTGFVFKLMGGAVSWSSKLQPTVAVSTTEAEYMAAAHAVREALWLRKLVSDLGVAVEQPVPILCDNQAALSLLHNPITSVRSKHIDVQHHFARERVARQEVAFTYCATDSNAADGLTKILPDAKHAKFVEGLGLV